MTKTSCDRCGKEGLVKGIWIGKYKQLCKDCLKKLKQWIEKGKS